MLKTVATRPEPVDFTQDALPLRAGVASARHGVPPPARAIASSGAFLCLSALLAYVGYFPMFASFKFYDDEGYWLIALRSYSQHGSLYHRTFSQCGPFYYEAWSFFYSVTGAKIDPDSAHLATLGIWVVTSLVFGIGVWVLTGRVLLGLAAQTVAFVLLFPLINEPMEPAGLAYLLAGFVLLGIALVRRGRPRLGMALVGVSTSALIFTKINIGLLVAGGLVYAFIVCWSSGRWSAVRKGVGALGLASILLVLTLPLIDQTWVQLYVVLIGASLGALIASVSGTEVLDNDVGRTAVRYAVGGAICTAIVISIAVLANGTSITELVQGAILGQRNLAQNFRFAPPVTSHEEVLAAGIAAAGVVAAILHRHSRGSARSGCFVPAIGRLVIGIWMLLTITMAPGGLSPAFTSISLPHLTGITPPGGSFVFAVPFAWLATRRPTRVADGPNSFPRVAIAAMAILGCLEAFPVGGSQFVWASLLVVPAAVLIIHDGVELLADRPWSETPLHIPVQRVARVIAFGCIALATAAMLWSSYSQTLSTYRAAYRTDPAIPSSGSQRIHLRVAQVERISEVDAFLQRHCSTFFSLPGLNSFYFFAHQSPPSDLNTTQWWNLLSPGQQAVVLAKLERTPRLCVIEEPTLTAFWDQGRPLRPTPLALYLRHDFVHVRTVGPYELFLRRPTRS
jgi:hypothetical protein